MRKLRVKGKQLKEIETEENDNKVSCVLIDCIYSKKESNNISMLKEIIIKPLYVTLLT